MLTFMHMTREETDALLASYPTASDETYERMYVFARNLVMGGNVVIPVTWDGTDVTLIVELDYKAPPVMTGTWPFATKCINSHNALALIDKAGDFIIYDVDSASTVGSFPKEHMDQMREYKKKEPCVPGPNCGTIGSVPVRVNKR